MVKQAKAASSTKRQQQKKVPAKFRDSAFVTGSAQAKFEAEMRDSRCMVIMLHPNWHEHLLY